MCVNINRISLEGATRILKEFRNEIDMLDLYNDKSENRISVNISFKDNSVEVSTHNSRLWIIKSSDNEFALSIPYRFYDSVVIK